LSILKSDWDFCPQLENQQIGGGVSFPSVRKCDLNLSFGCVKKGIE
jgi:hypothetical protein